MGERHARDNGSPAREGLAGLAIVAFAVGCCAGLPVLLVVASTVAIGTLLGVAAGVVALVVVVGATVWVRRRRAASGAVLGAAHGAYAMTPRRSDNE